MWYMKQFKLLILLLVIGFVAEAQINYLPMRSRYTWIAGKFDSTLHIPSGTTPGLRVGGHNGAAALFYRTSDSTVYVYTGNQWISVKGAGGSSDSSIFATLYRLDTAKTNIRTTLNTKIDSLRRSGLSVQAYKNGTWITQFTDSLGSGGGSITYADSLTVDTLIRGMGVKMYGNSLTYSFNGIQGIPYALQQNAELPVYRGGGSGLTIAAIEAKFNADAGKESRHYAHVFNMGRNNLTSGAYLSLRATLLPALARMKDTLAAYGNDRWVFSSITNGGGEGIGTAIYDTIIAVNNAVAALYPTHYVDVRSYLVQNYDPSEPKDLSNYAQDIPPYSMRVNSLYEGFLDSIHFNKKAYNLWGKILDSVAYNWLANNDGTDKVLTANKAIKLLSGQMPSIAAKRRFVLGNQVFGYAMNEYVAPKSLLIGNERDLTDSTLGHIVGVGPNVLDSATTAYYIAALGTGALEKAKAAYGVAAVGTKAGAGCIDCFGSVFIGLNTGSGNANSSGGNSTVGNGSLQNVEAGYNSNIGNIGLQTLRYGLYNFNGGHGGLYTLYDGSGNTNTGTAGLSRYLMSNAVNSGYNGSYNATIGTEITTGGAYTNYANQTGKRISTWGTYSNYGDGVTIYNTSDIAVFGAYSGYRNRGSHQLFIGSNSVRDTVIGNWNIAICDSCELPDRTASQQMTIGNLIFAKGGFGTGTTVGTGKIGIGTNNPLYKLDVSGTFRATDTVRFSGLPTGTKQYFITMDASGNLHRSDTTGLYGGSGGGGGGTTYKIGTYNSQTINGDGASIVGDSIYMQAFSAESPGLVPAGGSGTTYLRGDGTWQTVTAGAAGSNRQITFNSNGSSTGTDSLKWTASRLETTNGTRITVNGASVAGGGEDAALMVRSIDNVTGGIAIFTNANYAGQLRLNSATIHASATLTITSIGGDLRLNSSKTHIGGATTATSTAQINGSFATPVTNKTTTYTATISDHTLTADATSAAFTITLPTAVGITGRIYVIKKTDASGNAVTVGTTSSQTIDGSTTYSLASQYKYVTVQSNGANWVITSNN